MQHSPDRGVSEIIAFILVFAIIMGSIGIVYAVGFPSMLSYQDSEQVANAERAFDAMAENFNDVARHTAIEERSSEITLRGGTIETGDSHTVLAIYVPDGDPDTRIRQELGSFAYENDGERVVYEGGAVIRSSEDGGSALVRAPEFRCGDNTAIMTVVVIESEVQNLASAERQEIRVDEESTEVIRWDEELDTHPLEIDFSSDHTTGWEWAFDTDEWGGGGPFTCEVDSAIIRIVTVDISF